MALVAVLYPLACLGWRNLAHEAGHDVVMVAPVADWRRIHTAVVVGCRNSAAAVGTPAGGSSLTPTHPTLLSDSPALCLFREGLLDSFLPDVFCKLQALRFRIPHIARTQKFWSRANPCEFTAGSQSYPASCESCFDSIWLSWE